MQDFRPISLINSSFKLLLKVLANRLKGVLGNLISEEQTAFVKGRNINESIFMVNEVIHAMKTQGIDGLILKIDFSKAYDTVDWSCLLHVMECVNMNQHWINWIRVILETTKMSILINGSPTEEFSPKRGIRQGDPLAPYMFLLIGEVLSRLIDRAVSTGACQGINFKFHNRTISHFQYADDTVLFIQNSKKAIRGMKRVLLLFQSITGLAINFNKSLVYHTSNDRDCLKACIKILGCQPGSIPFKYLGDWVGLNVKPCSYWNSLVNQMQSKLQGWKCNNLNMAGRMVLLKSSLDSIPTYWFSLHKIPKQILEKMEGIRCKFFWGELANGEKYVKKLHSINWNIICS